MGFRETTPLNCGTGGADDGMELRGGRRIHPEDKRVQTSGSLVLRAFGKHGNCMVFLSTKHDWIPTVLLPMRILLDCGHKVRRLRLAFSPTGRCKWMYIKQAASCSGLGASVRCRVQPKAWSLNENEAPKQTLSLDPKP